MAIRTAASAGFQPTYAAGASGPKEQWARQIAQVLSKWPKGKDWSFDLDQQTGAGLVRVVLKSKRDGVQYQGELDGDIKALLEKKLGIAPERLQVVSQKGSARDAAYAKVESELQRKYRADVTFQLDPGGDVKLHLPAGFNPKLLEGLLSTAASLFKKEGLPIRVTTGERAPEDQFEMPVLEQLPASKARPTSGIAAPQPPLPAPAALGLGSRGDSVRLLQKKLAGAGFSEVGKLDGIFGPKTHAALLSFQKAKGLPATGTLDEATRSLVDKIPARPSSPSRIKEATLHKVLPEVQITGQRLKAPLPGLDGRASLPFLLTQAEFPKARSKGLPHFEGRVEHPDGRVEGIRFSLERLATGQGQWVMRRGEATKAVPLTAAQLQALDGLFSATRGPGFLSHLQHPESAGAQSGLNAEQLEKTIAQWGVAGATAQLAAGNPPTFHIAFSGPYDYAAMKSRLVRDGHLPSEGTLTQYLGDKLRAWAPSYQFQFAFPKTGPSAYERKAAEWEGERVALSRPGGSVLRAGRK